MFTLHSQPAVPSAIALHTPTLRRLFIATDALAFRFRHAWLRAAERRSGRRTARARAELTRMLDARTLRDIGLGEFAASSRDDAGAVFHRDLDLRGF